MSEVDHAALIRFTQELVKIPSVHDPERGLTEKPAAELVAETMRSFGWRPIVEEAAPGRPNVIAVLEGRRPGRTLLFEGHTDVVTEGDPSRWTHDPFGAEIVEGKLYGRGSADMKAGVGAMLFAAKALSEHDFPGRIVVAALADEEGMMLGVKDFVRRGHGALVDAAIICEPEGQALCIAQKGAIRIRVDARGRMAHGAMPQQGRNPIPALLTFLSDCAAHQTELQREHGEHALLGWNYITPTVFRAGDPEQINVIPGAAWAAVDVRTTPEVKHDQLIARLRTMCPPDVTLTVIDDRPPTETPPDHPLVRALLTAHERFHGRPPAFGGVPGSTDGTILWRDAHVPIVTYGPGGKWIAHQVDEYVELEDLTTSAEVYLQAARLFLDSSFS